MQRLTPRIVYIVIASIVSTAFALLTPPFQVPDEVAHYYRAETLALGGGHDIPASSRDFVAATYMSIAGLPQHYDAAKLASAKRIERSPAVVRVRFPSQYTFVPYIPQTAAMLIARVIHLRPFRAFYLGRLFNAACTIALVSF